MIGDTALFNKNGKSQKCFKLDDPLHELTEDVLFCGFWNKNSKIEDFPNPPRFTDKIYYFKIGARIVLVEKVSQLFIEYERLLKEYEI